MKKAVIILSVLMLIVGSCGQTKKKQTTETTKEIYATVSQTENIYGYDFSPLWLDRRTEYLGYIGDNYQRLYIWLDAVYKVSETEYQVVGRSKVKSNECNFSGTITLKDIHEFTGKEFVFGVDDCMKGKFLRQGTVFADFLLEENKKQKGSGIFRGTLQSKWYIDLNGRLKYDDIGEDSDSYANNQFSGIWTSYATKSSKKCAWGHYRIPNSDDLDIGAAEFSVNPDYINNGWMYYGKKNFRQIGLDEKIGNRTLKDYLSDRKIPQVFKNVFQQEQNLTDNDETLALIDSLSSTDKTRHPFYFVLVTRSMWWSDGAFSEPLGGAAKEYVESNTQQFLDYFSTETVLTQFDFGQWATYTLYEMRIESEDNIKKQIENMRVLMKKNCNGCSSEKVKMIDKFIEYMYAEYNEIQR